MFYYSPSIFFKIFIKVNVGGLGKDDLSISTEATNKHPYQAVIIIEGEKDDEMFGKTQVNNRFYLLDYPETLDAELENGYLTLTVGYKEPVQIPDVKVNWK